MVRVPYSDIRWHKEFINTIFIVKAQTPTIWHNTKVLWDTHAVTMVSLRWCLYTFSFISYFFGMFFFFGRFAIAFRVRAYGLLLFLFCWERCLTMRFVCTLRPRWWLSRFTQTASGGCFCHPFSHAPFFIQANGAKNAQTDTENGITQRRAHHVCVWTTHQHQILL